MKKIQTLVAQFDSKIQKETEDARLKFSGNVVKLKMLGEKLSDIENQKKGAIEGAGKVLDFLKKAKMLDLKVKGKNLSHKRIVIENLKLQFSSLKLHLETVISDLVQA